MRFLLLICLTFSIAHAGYVKVFRRETADYTSVWPEMSFAGISVKSVRRAAHRNYETTSELAMSSLRSLWVERRSSVERKKIFLSVVKLVLEDLAARPELSPREKGFLGTLFNYHLRYQGFVLEDPAPELAAMIARVKILKEKLKGATS